MSFIAERSSPPVADRYTSAVVETCERLALFPLRGVTREDVRPGLRVTHHKGRTAIAYAVDEKSRTVSVLGVLYGGRDLEGALAVDRDAWTSCAGYPATDVVHGLSAARLKASAAPVLLRAGECRPARFLHSRRASR